MDLPAFSSIAIGLDTLRANPLRTVLSTLGIIIGAAALVAVLALGDGLERFGREQIERTTDLQSVVVEPRTLEFVDGQAFPVEDYPVFTAATADSLLGRIPEAGAVLLGLQGRSPVRGPGGEQEDVLVAATLAGTREGLGLKLALGRYFSAEEARGNAAVVVLSHALAATLAGGDPGTLLGREVVLRERSRTVIGILAAVEGERGGAVHVPLEGQADALAPTPRPRAPILVLQARTVEQVPVVQTAVEDWLSGRHGTEWRRVARVSTNRARVAQVSQGMLVFKGFMGAITGISLLVGGIGIMNVLLAAVTERTREIGIRKAIGARRRDVLAQFLAESVAISGVGSLLGAALGLAGAFGITALIRRHSEAQVFAAFSWSTLAVAAGAALLIGLTFGMYPALRAARLAPIEAIRHE